MRAVITDAADVVGQGASRLPISATPRTGGFEATNRRQPVRWETHHVLGRGGLIRVEDPSRLERRGASDRRSWVSLTAGRPTGGAT